MIIVLATHILAQATQLNPKVKVTPEIIQRIETVEKEFSELNIVDFLAHLNLDKLDKLKNDFWFYRYTVKVNSEEASLISELGIPNEDESFSSGEVVERIKYNVNRTRMGGKSDKVVINKFVDLILKFNPAFDAMIADRQKSAAKQQAVEAAKNEKIRAEQDKIYNSPPCQKVNKFVEFCDNRKNLTEAQFQFDREKKLDARSGTQNLANTRHYTSVIMAIEDQVNKTSGALNKIKYSTPKQSDCEIRKIEDDAGLRFAYSEKTNKIVKELKKKNCQIDNWQPQDY
jgi:hypothetical protein